MNSQNLIDLKFLKEIENDKQQHIRRLNERIDEWIRMREILIKDIEKLESKINE